MNFKAFAAIFFVMMWTWNMNVVFVVIITIKVPWHENYKMHNAEVAKRRIPFSITVSLFPFYFLKKYFLTYMSTAFEQKTKIFW